MVFLSAAVNALNACCTFNPSCASTEAGTSMGFCVQKKIPIPFERISFTMVSICCSNAELASWKIRCASSMNITNFGLSKSPSSGLEAYNSANICSIKVEKSFGLSCRSVTRMIEMVPRPSSLIRTRSSISKLFSPKKRSAPCCCNSITLRKIVPVEVVEIFP